MQSTQLRLLSRIQKQMLNGVSILNPTMTTAAQHTWRPGDRDSLRYRSTIAAVQPREQTVPNNADKPSLKANVTSSFGEFISDVQLSDVSETVLRRSKRMMLDNLGVGLVGSRTEIAEAAVRHGAALLGGGDSFLGSRCSLWGRGGEKSSLLGATFANGVMTHAIDFDDTWHPATHPSGPVLPAVMALAQAIPGTHRVSGSQLLLAYNVGIEVQGLLLRFSTNAQQIPNRFHPPAVVGVMGSAAACAKLLGLDADRSRHALAIAASFAGAPMANAGTKAKPLHAGNSARFGLEAALLADAGVNGNEEIMDIPSGFAAYFRDYQPVPVKSVHKTQGGWSLDIQDIAFKRIPAHLSMHWASDAASNVRRHIVKGDGQIPINMIKEVVVDAPNSKYVNRPLPEDEHAARHSFQFNVGTTLLDGHVKVTSFSDAMLKRPSLQQILNKITVNTPPDNDPNFDRMYVKATVEMLDGTTYTARCTTPYGHWRNPLTDEDLQSKFTENARSAGLGSTQIEKSINLISNIEQIGSQELSTLFQQL